MQATHSVTRDHQAASPYFYIPFDVPEGTTRIDATLAYAKADDCVIDLGVFDPRDTGYPSKAGFRGWSGGARDRFFIATDDATPGYVHGEIQTGTWHIVLGLYKVPASGVDVSVTITFDREPRRVAPQPIHPQPVRHGAGWYRGDLHCHTFHSDARGAPETLHRAAQQAGLDFLAVTDHNTITQRRYFHPASSADLIFVRGMEITTAAGHANVFGVDSWIDFRMTAPADAHVLASLVHDQGGLLSINHDKPDIPWDYAVPAADCQEVWQSTWLDRNWISLARYQERLASGMRLSAIGGSDFHQPAELRPEGPLVLARPTTVLWLPELSEAAILAAMKAGHGYITEGPQGPHLEIRAGAAAMGDVATDLSVVDVTVCGAQGDQLVLVDATGTIAIREIPTADWQASISLDTVTGFVRAEIIAVASHDDMVADLLGALDSQEMHGAAQATIAAHPIRRALSNPVYAGTMPR
jgi:hypothetical protein